MVVVVQGHYAAHWISHHGEEPTPVLVIKEGRYFLCVWGKDRSSNPRLDQAQFLCPLYTVGSGSVNIHKIAILLGNNLECLGVNSNEKNEGRDL